MEIAYLNILINNKIECKVCMHKCYLDYRRIVILFIFVYDLIFFKLFYIVQFFFFH